MKAKRFKRFLASLMAFLMVAGLMPANMGGVVTAKADSRTYTLESKDLTAFAAAAKTDGETTNAGTDDYFTMVWSAKSKVDSSSKTFDDAYASEQRINFGGAASTEKNAIKFTTDGAASVKIWWVEGGDDNRQMGILNGSGTVVTKTNDTVAKNATCISTLELTEAGTYYLGGVENNNNIYKVAIEVEQPAQEKISTLESKDLTAFAAAAKTDGETTNAGTDDYFTMVWSAKSKVDSSSKTFDDTYASEQRINFGGAASTEKNAIKFTTNGAASVKIWWVEGGDDNRQMGILNGSGTVVTKTNDTVAKNATCISTLELTEAGTYYLGGVENNNNIYKVVVTESGGSSKPERKSWSEVSNPSFGEITAADGTITVGFNMVVGYDGADKVTVTMKDQSGEVLDTKNSSKEGNSASVEFTPTASGNYTFSIAAVRKDETDKTGADKTFTGFVLPLAAPSMSSATSVGNGGVDVVWNAVDEATGYMVAWSLDGGATFGGIDTTTDTHYTFKGLTIGTQYTFYVQATRGEDKGPKSEIVGKPTEDAQAVWAFSGFGQGISAGSNNYGYEGSANDGSVQVWNLNNKGKLVPASTDGLAFYYTAIPTSKNFTLSATITLDSWTYTNGQEGFGLMAADRVGVNGDSSVFWNNSYMAAATKVEYHLYNETPDETIDLGKVTMKDGLGSQEKIGVTPDNLAKLEANDTDTVNNEFKTSQLPLEQSCAERGVGTYNILGNFTNSGSSAQAFLDTTVAKMTTFKMTIQRNNTGYFVSYTDEAGNTTTNKYYDTKALDQLDSENVYAGFFASRTCKATFSDISLTTIDPADDAPVETQPITTILPTAKIVSASVANDRNYTLQFAANADGLLSVKDGNNNAVATDMAVKADVVAAIPNLELEGEKNKFVVYFTPDKNYQPGEFVKMASYEPIGFEFTVTYNPISSEYIYVTPNGSINGDGSKNNPVDVWTAVKRAKAGSTIILAGGKYSLLYKDEFSNAGPINIPRGIDGTAENPIKMIADPESAERPVFDAGGQSAVMVLAGNYWYFKGFDVTNSSNSVKGLQLSGSYCTLDQVNAYHNGNTGIQLSRLNTTDQFADWPHDNLILNCTSYGNADAGYEDADGFAAKLTIGNNNVFDGCIAYNNADDGWDLFAKVETGPIGSVTIKNSVAFGNGYLEDGTNAGNGNGFKMGGSSISGYHSISNSVAFGNKAKGFDSNSCPDIQVSNCTSFNNESNNIAFYTNDAANTDFSGSGILSYKTLYTDVYENFKLKGTQDNAKVYQATDYYWATGVTAPANSSVGTVKDSWFASVDPTAFIRGTGFVKGVSAAGGASVDVLRNDNGTINMNNFMVLTSEVPSGTGAVMGGTASGNITVSTGETSSNDSDDEDTSSNNNETTETPAAQAPAVVIVPVTPAGSADVAAAVNTIAAATAGSTVAVDMGTTTIIPQAALTAAAGKDVNITMKVGGVLWTINGKNITSPKDVDLGVQTGTNNIPAEVVGAVAADKETIQLHLDYEGQFGFTAIMELAMGAQNTGKYANLFYYNPYDNVLEFVTVGQIAADGSVDLTLTHASDYVIVLDDKAYEVAAGTPVESTEAAGTAEGGNAGVATGDTTPIMLYVLLAILACGVLGGAVFFKKRKNM